LYACAYFEANKYDDDDQCLGGTLQPTHRLLDDYVTVAIVTTQFSGSTGMHDTCSGTSGKIFSVKR